ncbi:VOC family protein [Tellurirhabdus bombi]|uniref:VOC family protein n=1 Tax=Tellurirhabdus bombi TaxID=2907205 RepID=UPI001F2D8FCE|nr:VOC family protein [Tellurirhabdus bombi]
MATKIFVNLPVKNLDQSVAFFTKLGFTFNPQFTDEKATCMVVGDDNYVMLLVEPFFQSFTKKELNNTSTTAETIIALTADNRQQVDELADKAIAAGATTYAEPIDQGFMYSRSFQDLDGHHWEFFYMDPKAVEPQ